jgi:hypothetical protein
MCAALSGCRDSRLYAHAAGASGPMAALFAGIFRNVCAGFRAASAGSGARERDAARKRRAGRQRVSIRSRSNGTRSGIRVDHQQQHGCVGRPRFRARLSVCCVDHDAALEPPGRGLDSVLERGVRMAGTGRRRHQRLELDASEEESRFAARVAASSVRSARCTSR